MTTDARDINTTATPVPGRPRRFKDADYRSLAWLLLFSSPISWLAGFAAAHIPYIFWPQYVEGEGKEPLWFGLITTAIFLVVMAIPPALAIWFGRKAVAARYRNANVAVWLGVTWLAANAVMLLAGLVGMAIAG